MPGIQPPHAVNQHHCRFPHCCHRDCHQTSAQLSVIIIAVIFYIYYLSLRLTLVLVLSHPPTALLVSSL